jgi:hypothetical protein
MDSIFLNGGMIGPTLDFGSTDQYILSINQERVRPVLVGSQTYSRAGATTTLNVAFSLTGGISSTLAAGDVVVLAICLGSVSTALMTAPAGYTQLARFTASDNNDSILYVGYKIMGSTPDTTFPIPSALDAANSQAATVFVWRGVDVVTPIDVTTTTATGTNARTPNPPAITPTTANSVVMAIGAAAHTGGTLTFTSSGLSGFRTIGSNDTYDCTIGTGYIDWTSGVVDPASFSIATTTSDSWTAVTLALRAAIQDVTTYGNKKNSGVWSIQSYYNSRLSTNWGLNGATLIQTVVLTELGSQEGNGVYFSPDGMRMYIADRLTQQRLSQYNLSTPWDPNTRTLVTTVVNTYDGTIHGIRFSPDGTKYYWGGAGVDRVGEFTMSTPWDILSASASTPSAQAPSLGNLNPLDWSFNKTGTLIGYGLNQTAAWVIYPTDTPWSISHSTVAAATGGDGSVYRAATSFGGPNSEYFYVGGSSTESAPIYRTVYSGGTITIDQTLSIEKPNCQGMYIDPDYGNFMWLIFEDRTLQKYRLTKS